MTSLSNYSDEMVCLKVTISVFINNVWIDYTDNLVGYSLLSQGSEFTYGYRETEAEIEFINVQHDELFMINTPIRLVVYNMQKPDENPHSSYSYTFYTQKRTTKTDRGAKIKCKGQLDKLLENKPRINFASHSSDELVGSVKTWTEKLLNHVGIPYIVPEYNNLIKYPINTQTPISKQISHFLGAYFGNLYIDNDGILKLVSVSDVLNNLIPPVAVIGHGDIYMESGFRSVSVADRYYFNRIKARGYNIENSSRNPLFSSAPSAIIPQNQTLTYVYSVDKGFIVDETGVSLVFVTDMQNPKETVITNNIEWSVVAQAPDTKVQLVFTISNDNGFPVYLHEILYNGLGVRYTSRLEKVRENKELVELEGVKESLVDSLAIQSLIIADSVVRIANYASSGYVDVTVAYNPQLLFGAYIKITDVDNVEKGGIILKADHKFYPFSNDMSVQLLIRLLPDTVQSSDYLCFEDRNTGFEYSGFDPNL